MLLKDYDYLFFLLFNYYLLLYNMICRNDYSVNRPICVYNIFYTYTSIEKAKCLQE